MKYTQAEKGRVFVLRLEDGEIIHEVIERFAFEHNIGAASLIIIGGAAAGSTLVVGPEDGTARPVQPLEETLTGVSEISGTGTIFPDAEGKPVLHMHIACGRRKNTVTGCVRRGVRVWQVVEVVITELVNCRAKRLPDADTGFELLSP
jgi:predicted DNA-binding protein with PD1-like motif